MAAAQSRLSLSLFTLGMALGTYLGFDALRVTVPHPLVALGGIGNLLVKESVDRGSTKEGTDLSREQGRVQGAVLRP